MLEKIKNITHSIYYFFPVQLLILHFKKNQVLLVFWLILFLVISGKFGDNLGVPYLFLDPEYQNHVSFASMLIMGISFGVFTTTFYITTYILDSHRFNFLGTIKNPFAKYSLNNSILPLAFIVLYIANVIEFQSEKGLESTSDIAIQIMGFLTGFSSFLLIIFTYFRRTNRDLFKALAKNVDRKLKEKKINVVQVIQKIDNAKKRRNYRIHSYLDSLWRYKLVDDNVTYDKSMLSKVFDQHHINAVTVEILIFFSIMIIGMFKDNPTFQIPAAASGMLLFSFFIMFTGAFSYWLRGWAISGMVIVVICYNYLVKNEIINSNYEAFGLNYNTTKVDYSLETIHQLNSDKNYLRDIDSTKVILENWRAKFPANKPPKIVFICTSGGGQRAAVWTTQTLQHIDKEIGGDLMDRTMLITGASGGLIGASYFRELYYRKKLGQLDSIHSTVHIDNISKDILNPMIFSLVVSDIFLRFQKHTVGEYEYYKGRGYAFERQLNLNTNFVLDRKVEDYKEPEKNSEIPMIIMAPTIINDARKLFISPQRISYMNRPGPGLHKTLIQRDKGVEFNRLFEEQDAKNLEFTSALRMNATFPYVTPNVVLPSSPKIEVMDAGLSDNFGVGDAIRFIQTFKTWINENTDGAVIIMIRDSDKDPFIKKNVKQSMVNKLINPVGSIYSNWDYMQDFHNDNALEYTFSALKGKLDVIPFQYIPKPKGWTDFNLAKIDYEKFEEEFNKERASLSWHLTNLEKESIKRTILEDNNVAALNRLKKLLSIDPIPEKSDNPTP